MIVSRLTLYVKPGRGNEASELALMENKRRGFPRAVRFYASKFGRFETFAMESEFESLAEYEQFWNAYWATPEAAAFAKKWHEWQKLGVQTSYGNWWHRSAWCNSRGSWLTLSDRMPRGSMG